MRLLVIGSCTGEKDTGDCDDVLTEADFDDPSFLSRREAELAPYSLPAGKLYTGKQHLYMMNGISRLRSRFGAPACSLKVISAGYGLVDEEQPIVPYNATSQRKRSKWILDRSRRLGIPEAVRTAIRSFDCVMFLLGKEYLMSIELPLHPSLGQRFVFFTSNIRLPFDRASTIVPAGRAETRFGAVILALKGKMFGHFASGLCRHPDRWSEVCSDETPQTVLSLIEEGYESV
jgi:hypothetical protein